MSKIWAVSCGKSGKKEWLSMWHEWLEKNHVTIGSYCNFSLLNQSGPLTAEEIAGKILANEYSKTQQVSERKAIAQAKIAENFAFKIMVGDYIVARVGLSEVLGIAEVVGPIDCSNTSFYPKEHYQFRKVRWLKTFSNAIVLENSFHIQSTIEDLHMSFTQKPDGKLNITYQEYKGSVPRDKSVKLVQEILSRCEIPYC